MLESHIDHVKTRTPGIVVRKKLGSLRVPKKAVNKSILESVSIESVDYTEDIHPHLLNSYRFRKLATQAVQIDEAWVIHNRKLEDNFAKTRKRLQKDNSFGRCQNVNVAVCTGFAFSEHWKDVEAIATDGLKPGNLPTTWLGKPNSGITVSQCADLSLAHFSEMQISEMRKTQKGRNFLREPGVEKKLNFYIVLVRWLKARVYVVSEMKPESDDVSGTDTRLDPQPGYTSHMTKWNRMDALDPAKTTLEAAFHNSQVYLYEYDDEMDLMKIPTHVVPFAVVKCRWKFAIGQSENPCLGVNDGVILLSKTPFRGSNKKRNHSVSQIHSIESSTTVAANLPHHQTMNSTVDPGNEEGNEKNEINDGKNRQRCLLETPPIALLPLSRSSVVTMNQSVSTSVGLLGSPVVLPPLIAPAIIRPIHQINFAPRRNLNLPLDQSVLSGRSMQLTDRRIGVRPCTPASDGQTRYMINCCNLVWPVNPEQLVVTTDHCHKSALGEDNNWQFPVEIISYRHPGFSIYEGILNPRYVISGMISVTCLHYELAGIEDPSLSTPISTISTITIATNTPASAMDATIDSQKGAVCGLADLSVAPYVCLDREREWTVPTPDKDSAENAAAPVKRGRFAGYRGNYFLLTLPDPTNQRCEVAKLCETLRCRQMACYIRMPCDANAVFCIFPDSDFSRSLGIPQLDSLEAVSFHGIMLLPHSMHNSLLDKCACRFSVKKSFKRTSLLTMNNKWGITLSSLVAALPDGGKGLLRKTMSLVSDGTDLPSPNVKTPTHSTSPQNKLSMQPAPVVLITRLAESEVQAMTTSTIPINNTTPSSPINLVSLDPPSVKDLSRPHSFVVPVLSTDSPTKSCDMEFETSTESGNSTPQTGNINLDLPKLIVPPAPDKYSPHFFPGSLYTQATLFSANQQIKEHRSLLPTPDKKRKKSSVLSSADVTSTIKLTPQDCFASYDDWKAHDNLVKRQTSSNSASTSSKLGRSKRSRSPYSTKSASKSPSKEVDWAYCAADVDTRIVLPVSDSCTPETVFEEKKQLEVVPQIPDPEEEEGEIIDDDEMGDSADEYTPTNSPNISRKHSREKSLSRSYKPSRPYKPSLFRTNSDEKRSYTPSSIRRQSDKKHIVRTCKSSPIKRNVGENVTTRTLNPSISWKNSGKINSFSPSYDTSPSRKLSGESSRGVAYERSRLKRPFIESNCSYESSSFKKSLEEESSYDSTHLRKHVDDSPYETSFPRQSRNSNCQQPSTSKFVIPSQDVDYRVRLPHSSEVSTFNDSGDHDYRVYSHRDTDSRYQVYVPKSAEAVSMPVKVINHSFGEPPMYHLPSHETDERISSITICKLEASSPPSSPPLAPQMHSTLSPHFICPPLMPIPGTIGGSQTMSPSFFMRNGAGNQQPLLGLPNLAACPSQYINYFNNQAASLLPSYTSIMNCPTVWGSGSRQ